jgi:23S rRNA pseudouridine1911/1915/1917 synthase
MASPPLQKRALTAVAADRLDRALAAAFPDLSRARFQRLIADGQVTVEGAVARDAGLRLRGGEAIAVTVPEARPARPAAEDVPLAVVHEDDDLIVIDKPPGLVVHPGAGNESGTLVNALISHCGASLSGVGGERRPGIVHRLDKDTSGLLVAAKNDLAHRGLAEQFAAHGRDGLLERSYLAIVWGRPERATGTISAALARSSANRQKMAVSRSATARPAVTHYEVLETYGKPPLASLLRCRLETGRTHQIRVHLAHLGHPLLGDATYGGGFKSSATKLPEAARHALKALNRQALHAASLGFRHPRTGRMLRFSSPPPIDFQTLLETLCAPSRPVEKL